jgi:endonuclease/exonuclease/phosphatase family metal-dependent hydrolase
MRFTVATYNIHKGFSHLTRRVVIHELRERLHGLSADVLFLQEVQGVHRRHARRYRNWPVKPQHEFIAGTVWH